MFPNRITNPQGKVYLPEIVTPPPASNLYRILWDDEIAEFGYRSRTAAEDWGWGPQAPAVFRYYPVLKDGAGDFRINITTLETFIRALMGGDARKFDWWRDEKTAQFNGTGWPMFAYISTSGNLLRGRRIVRDGNNIEMLEFDTLTIPTVQAGMTYETHPHFIHRFGIVGVDKNGSTYHTQNTNQGLIDYPMVTKEGVCYIPTRYVRKV